MPGYVVDRVAEALNTVKKPINGSRIHLIGVAYKRDVNDLRESPALDVIELLAKRGAALSYTDPFVPELSQGGHVMPSVEWRRRSIAARLHGDLHGPFGVRLRGDCRSGTPVVDTRNALQSYDAPTIFRL